MRAAPDLLAAVSAAEFPPPPRACSPHLPERFQAICRHSAIRTPNSALADSRQAALLKSHSSPTGGQYARRSATFLDSCPVVARGDRLCRGEAKSGQSPGEGDESLSFATRP